MPTKRTRVGRHLSNRISPEAVEAYRRRDFIALHVALNLRPWQASPLPLEDCALGVDQGPPPDDGRGKYNPWGESWFVAQELQRELEAAIAPE